jgi:hypothetical protein
MLGRLAVLTLVLLVAPTATAFPTSNQELYIAYDGAQVPVVLATGALALEGAGGRALLIGASNGTSFHDIPTLRIFDRTTGTEQTLSNATLVVETGIVLWTSDSAGTLAIDAGAAYGIGLGLPRAPLPSADGETIAGYLLASERVTGTAQWPGGDSTILPLDAVVTVRDAQGGAVWQSRHVNADATPGGEVGDLDMLITTQGAYTARIDAGLLTGAADDTGTLTLRVAPAQEDRLRETVALLAEAGRGFFGEGDSSEMQQLDVLGQISGLLNGALLVIPGPEAEATPRESRIGADEFPLGAFTLVRGGETQLSWEEGEMRVAGEPSVALGRDGFAVAPPASVGILPVASLVLWLFALGAIVAYLVKRPPEGRHQLSMRLLSLGLWLLVLVGVFFFWDKSFEQTFGVGVISTLAQGMSGANLGKAGILLMLELVPWGIAALLFALPVRIATGIGLRYLGRGKSFKGVATAAGLLSLAVFGPSYALWCFNLVWERAATAMGG